MTKCPGCGKALRSWAQDAYHRKNFPAHYGMGALVAAAQFMGELKDSHERECADAAIAARLEKAKGKGRKEWLAFRKAMLGC